MSEQVLPATADYDHVRLEPRIGLEELPFDLLLGEREPTNRGEARWDADAFIEVASEPEILIRREAGTGPVGAVFVDDQGLARHDVAHVVDHGLRHPGPPQHSTTLGPSPDVLRPEPMQGEGMGSFGVAFPVVPLPSLGRAIGRRPAENEDVIVEASRFAAVLGVRHDQGQRCH